MTSIYVRPIILICIIHLLVWTIFPTIFEGSIRLDVAEGIIDGPEWQLSYLRHPPISSWLIGLLIYCKPYQYFALYCLAQIFILISLTIILFLFYLQQITVSLWLVVAMYLLSPFATYIALQFNHNITLLPFWAGVIFTGWFAFDRGKLSDWVLFAISCGLGVWAKYAIFQLIAPIGFLFLCVPHWRRHLLGFGPYVAVFTGLVIIFPHILDVWAKGGTTLSFAFSVEQVTFNQIIYRSSTWLLNTVLYNLFFGFILIFLIGLDRLKVGMSEFVNKCRNSKFDLYIFVCAIGPIVLVLVATFIGKRSHILWLTPMSISFILLWGRIASLALSDKVYKPEYKKYFILSLLFLTIYVSNRFTDAKWGTNPLYAEMNAKNLFLLTSSEWSKRFNGHILYIVSFNGQKGRQAAGSIAFESPLTIHVLEDGSTTNAPWINMSDLLNKGALVVAPLGMPNGAQVNGRIVTDKFHIDRPMERGAIDPYNFEVGFIPPIQTNR